jgi:hypothetical protein
MTAEVLNSTITFASFIPHRIEAVENVASQMAFTVFYSPLATRHSRNTAIGNSRSHRFHERA